MINAIAQKAQGFYAVVGAATICDPRIAELHFGFYLIIYLKSIGIYFQYMLVSYTILCKATTTVRPRQQPPICTNL